MLYVKKIQFFFLTACLFFSTVSGVVAENASNSNPSIKVELTTYLGDGQTFIEGDQVTLLMGLSHSAFVTMVYLDAGGQYQMLVPNQFQPQRWYQAGDFISVPDIESTFKIVIGPPFGQDVIWVLASSKEISLEGLPTANFAELKKTLMQRVTQLNADFGETQLILQTSPKRH